MSQVMPGNSRPVKLDRCCSGCGHCIEATLSLYLYQNNYRLRNQDSLPSVSCSYHISSSGFIPILSLLSSSSSMRPKARMATPATIPSLSDLLVLVTLGLATATPKPKLQVYSPVLPPHSHKVMEKIRLY